MSAPGPSARRGSAPRAQRDPARGLRAIGAAALSLECLAVLMALAPTYSQRHLPAWQLGLLGAVAVLLAAAAATQRRPAGRALGTVAQLATIAAGVLTWPLYALGALFGLLWVYYVRLAVRFTTPPAA